MKSKIVVHLPGGNILKGFSKNLFPNKPVFHLIDKDSGEVSDLELARLKAVFFVKSFEGDSDYEPRSGIDRPGFGKKIEVCFKDGETIVGYTSGYSANRTAFYLFPEDPESNNDRILVVNAATEKVTFL